MYTYTIYTYVTKVSKVVAERAYGLLSIKPSRALLGDIRFNRFSINV